MNSHSYQKVWLGSQQRCFFFYQVREDSNTEVLKLKHFPGIDPQPREVLRNLVLDSYIH